jgi:phosphopantetheinyl transferase
MNKNHPFLKRAQLVYMPYFREAFFWTIRLEAIEKEEVLLAKEFIDAESLNSINSYVFPEDRAKRIITHAILRFYLAEILKEKPQSLKTLKNNFGKPFIKNFSLQFNLSHTKKWAFFGVHPNHSIGVDIEEIQKLEISDTWVYESEKNLMHCFADRDLFCSALWCAKEALVKAKGRGFLSKKLPQFQKIKRLSEETYLFHSQDEKVFISRKKIDDHLLATCVVNTSNF